MVARLFRLRVALLLAPFRAGAGRALRGALLGIVLLGGGIGLAWLPVWFAPAGEMRAALDVVISSGVVFASGVVPFFAHQRHLEPRQFAPYAVSPSAVSRALFITTLLSPPVLWVLAWMLAWGVLRRDASTPWWLLICAGALTLAVVMASARVASALAKWWVPEGLTGTIRMVGFFLLVAMLPAGVFAVAQMVADPRHQAAMDAAGILQWTPLGASAAIAVGASSGYFASLLFQGVIALAWVLVLLAAWWWLVRVSLSSVARPQDAVLTRRSMGLFGRFSTTPSAVIGARTLTYWLRDPRYRVGVAAAPIAVALMVLALAVAGVGVHVLALFPVPLLLLLLGWSLHNDLAMDSTAIWVHVASGTRGRDDRLGRLAPLLVIGLPLVVVGSSVSVTIAADWRILPAVLGFNLAVLCVSGGVSSVCSVWLPYATTRPGESPFVQPVAVGNAAGVAPGVAMFASLLLCVPAVLVVVPALTDVTFGANLLAWWVCAAYGLVVLGVGVLIGGRVFDRTGSKLVALTQSFD